MNRADFVKLIGAGQGETEYLPVACLLRSGYGIAGYYNTRLNMALSDTCVLLNVQMVELRDTTAARGRGIDDFNDFIEDVATRFYQEESDPAGGDKPNVKTVPLLAVPMDEIAAAYPVAQITKMFQAAADEATDQNQQQIPTFFDLDKSLLLKVLRTKLW